jgi:DNA gyrase subunit A
MKDDVTEEEPIIGEDGEIIPAATIERVKPVLEILEDDGVADEDDDEDDEEIEDEDDADDAEDENEE